MNQNVPHMYWGVFLSMLLSDVVFHPHAKSAALRAQLIPNEAPVQKTKSSKKNQ